MVPQSKITGYLLSSAHRDSRSKALFFTGFGFSNMMWEVLANALLKHAADNQVTKVEDSPFGTRYTIEEPLKTPDNRNPIIRSVWFVEAGESVPRFVTAYPLKG